MSSKDDEVLATHLVVFPHLVRDKVSVLKLVNESVASVVNQKTTDTTQRFGGKEFDLLVSSWPAIIW